MNKTPLVVLIVAVLFIGSGTVGFIYHAGEFKGLIPFDYELVWVCVLRVLAIVCGVYLLLRRDWARWLALIWLAYHVILSGFHSMTQFLVHGLLLAVIAYFLTRPKVSEYFRRGAV